MIMCKDSNCSMFFVYPKVTNYLYSLYINIILEDKLYNVCHVLIYFKFFLLISYTYNCCFFCYYQIGGNSANIYFEVYSSGGSNCEMENYI